MHAKYDGSILGHCTTLCRVIKWKMGLWPKMALLYVNIEGKCSKLVQQAFKCAKSELRYDVFQAVFPKFVENALFQYINEGVFSLVLNITGVASQRL